MGTADGAAAAPAAVTPPCPETVAACAAGLPDDATTRTTPHSSTRYSSTRADPGSPAASPVLMCLWRHRKNSGAEVLCFRGHDGAIALPTTTAPTALTTGATHIDPAESLYRAILPATARHDRPLRHAVWFHRHDLSRSAHVAVIKTSSELPARWRGSAWMWVPVGAIASSSLTASQSSPATMATLGALRFLGTATRSVLPSHLRGPPSSSVEAASSHARAAVPPPPAAPSPDAAVTTTIAVASAFYADLLPRVERSTAPASEAGAASDNDVTVDAAILDTLLASAKQAARRRGSNRVSPQDVAAAARALHTPPRSKSPADHVPAHYDSLLGSLVEIRDLVNSSQGAGVPPRVLVVGETSGTVAGMFLLAGADVATCDLKPTETPHIPHFQGDASHIQDQGWDLVIAHPPCTYLSNAGLVWLYRDPDRVEQLKQAAQTFNRMAAADAPFVAIENPKMHRFATALVGGRKPTQYVHPWQHGTGHTKPTGLYLKNLPQIEPTEIVAGREPAMARLPPSPTRSEDRSRTYKGIAAAMALQWMPTLIEHIRSHSRETLTTAPNGLASAARPTWKAADLVEQLHQRLSADELLAVAVPPSQLGDAQHRVAAHVTSPVSPTDMPTSATTTPPTYRPWQHEPPKVERKDPSIDRVQRRHGEWVVWKHSTTTGRHAWLPLSAATSALLTLELRPPIDEAGLLKAADVDYGDGDSTRAASVRPWQHELLWKSLRLQWSKRPLASGQRWVEIPYEKAKYLEELYSEELSEALRHRREFTREEWMAFDIRRLHIAHYVKSNGKCYSPKRPIQEYLGLGADENTPGREPLPPFAKGHGHCMRRDFASRFRKAESEPTAITAAVMPTGSTHEEDTVVTTPQPFKLTAEGSLFVQGLTVCRRAQTRGQLRQGRHTFYSVDVALAIANALADTGAGPSIVTTQLLAQLPADAVIRDQHAHTLPVVGPDGNPLERHGTAQIVFDLNGKAFSHLFLVVEGSPLLLLGNDFLKAHRARIDLGAGQLDLDTSTRRDDGPPRWHHVAVDTAPRLTTAAAVSPIAQQPVDRVAHERAVMRRELGVPRPGDSVILSQAASRGLTTKGTDAGHAAAASAPLEKPPWAKEPTDHRPTTATPEEAPPEVDPLPSTPAEFLDKTFRYTDADYLLYSGAPIRIPARSRATVWVNAPKTLAGGDHECTVERLPVRPGLEEPPLIQSACCRVNAQGKVPVTIWNLGRNAYTHAGFAPLAKLNVEIVVYDTALNTDAPKGSALERLTPEQLALLDSIKIDPQGVLTPEQRQEVRELVARHITAFASDPKNPTKTHLMEVELPTLPDVKPHRHQASRLGEKGREIVDKHVAEMESRGIIRKSNSAWASRVVLVAKKNGEIRFCTDYRDLNSKLQLLDSPIPLTIEAIDRLSSGTGDPSSLLLSTLDLAAGFWTLPIREQDKHLTAFVTHRGKYEYNYLPFGVQSGPSYMCRLMDAALQGLAWEVCMPYLDDVGVWSTGVGATPEERHESSFKQQLHRLDLVFERLKWAGLSCKASKCELFATSAEYLGHIISRDGLKMDPKKIATVKDLDVASICSLDKVRSFLGLCSYYRRFIKDFSKIATPLTDLTRKGVDVETEVQQPKCQEAIKALINAITSEPVLATPRYDRQFILKSDAANTEGLGAVLSQKDDDGHERVIAYYGRRLNTHERNYTVTEIELLAALEAIKHWRPYLWGRRFHLVIDHAALKWLHSMKDTVEGGPASRLMRWILKLSEYNFSIEHKPGAIHKDADGVSRLAAAVRAGVDPFSRLVGVIAAAARHDQSTVSSADNTGRRRARDARAAKGISKRIEPSSTRSPVTTARRLQSEARSRRAKEATRSAVLTSYLCPVASSEGWRKAQQEDEECHAFLAVLDGTFDAPTPDSAALRRASWYMKEADHMAVVDGLLYHCRGSTASVAAGHRLVVPSVLRPPLLHAYHDQFGHPGSKKMIQLISSRYYWPNMASDVEAHVAECHECTLSKRPPRAARQALSSKIGTYPFDVVYCDVLDMADTHDYVKGASGHRKLLVFIDSVSRWVEAVPCHSDPTAEQALDAFMTQVVARHGAPRVLRSDLGSNLSAKINDAILERTGVDLRPSTAEHHESMGLVERFNSVVTNYTRATDEGGRHWADHLPFLIFSYNATPHRVTQLSPAAVLYGRELRLPAQLDEAHAQPSLATVDSSDTTPSAVSVAVQRYARRLHDQLILCWGAATAHTAEAQKSDGHDAQRKSVAPPSYQVGDRVCRRLPDSDANNKLLYQYAGPYRVRQVLPNGRILLRDLENNHIHDEFSPANLRPYRTQVDEFSLQLDEYLVDKLLHHRDVRGTREYRVKWRGYPKSQATWEPRGELERRCAELVAEYERALMTPAPRIPRPADPDPLSSVAVPPPAPRASREYESDDLPNQARFARGAWLYGRFIATPRGKVLRWFAESAFTSTELSSAPFQALRQSWEAEQLPTTVALVAHAAAFSI